MHWSKLTLWGAKKIKSISSLRSQLRLLLTFPSVISLRGTKCYSTDFNISRVTATELVESANSEIQQLNAEINHISDLPIPNLSTTKAFTSLFFHKDLSNSQEFLFLIIIHINVSIQLKLAIVKTPKKLFELLSAALVMQKLWLDQRFFLIQYIISKLESFCVMRVYITNNIKNSITLEGLALDLTMVNGFDSPSP